jgi:hypothetical protein
MTVTALVNWRCGRDFAREMAFNPQNQNLPPLGEVRLTEMLGEQKPAKGKAKRKRSKRR